MAVAPALDCEKKSPIKNAYFCISCKCTHYIMLCHKMWSASLCVYLWGDNREPIGMPFGWTSVGIGPIRWGPDQCDCIPRERAIFALSHIEN